MQVAVKSSASMESLKLSCGWLLVIEILIKIILLSSLNINISNKSTESVAEFYV